MKTSNITPKPALWLTVLLFGIAIFSKANSYPTKHKASRTFNTPIVIYGFLHPKKEKAQELKKILVSLVEPTRAEKGNLKYHIHEEENGAFFIYEVWASQEDLDRHIQLPHVQNFFINRMEYLERDVEAHFGKMITSYNLQKQAQ